MTNMIEAGLAVFDRYHIVSERRLKEMAGKLEVHLKAKDDKPEQHAGGPIN